MQWCRRPHSSWVKAIHSNANAPACWWLYDLRMKFRTNFSLPLTQKILLVVAIPLSIQLIFIVFMSNDLSRLVAAQNQEQHYIKVVMSRDRLLINERQRTMIIAMYLATLDPTCQQNLARTLSDTVVVFNELRELWRDNPERRKILDRCWSIYSLRGDSLVAMVERIGQKHDIEEMLGGMSGNREMIMKIMMIKKIPYLEKLFDEDREQKNLQAESVRQNQELIYRSLYVGLATLILASLVSGLIFSFSISRRLKIVLSNIGALTDSQANLIVIKGGDEISQLNDAVVTTVTKIREAEEFQAQTIAIIADELNKPLTEVEAALQQLSKCGFVTLSEKGSKRLHDSSAEIKRLEALVFELVNLDASERDLQLSQVDMSDLAENCIKIVEPLTRLRSISVTLNSVAKNSVVYADGDKITQVLINFLSNAIKYSPDNATIEINIETTEQTVKVSIRDHGPGIAQEFHSKIFQRFEQAESASASKPASSGLGLAISKEIIESQGGSVGFSSKIGDGSTFWLSLSTTKPQLSNQSSITAIGTPQKGWKPTLWKKALLVVALPILVQLFTVATMYNFLQQNSLRIAELEKIPAITSLHEKLLAGLAWSGIAAMNYNLERDPKSIAKMKFEEEGIRQHIAELHDLTGTDKTTDKLLAVINAHLALDQHIVQAKKNADISLFVGEKGLDDKNHLLVDIRTPMHELITEQNELIASNELASDEMRRNFQTLLLLSVIAASIVAGALGLLIAHSLTKRAKRLSDIALRFSNHRELPQPLPGDDELAFVEQQLHEAGKKLMKLEILRAEMIGITSHELRTPLTSLIALIEVIEAGVFGELTAEGSRLLEKARLETSELIVLISNLLDLEKMESGKILVSKHKMQVENVLEQIKSDNAMPATQRGINLTVNHCQEEIFADSNRLTQAMTAVIRSIFERIPSKSNVIVECNRDQNTVVLAVEAPHGVAAIGSGYNKHKQFAREQMAISLARLTAVQHGGDLHLTTSSKGRRIALNLPVGA